MKRLVLFIFLNGCFFGVYQRPKTLGEGNYDFSAGASFQFTTNPYDRKDLEIRDYGLAPNFGFSFAYGVINGIDIGFNLSGAGMGPFGRFSIFKQKYRKVENEIIFAPYVLYDPFFSKSLGLRVDFIYSWQISKYFEPFIFYQLYYHPYFEEFSYEDLGYKVVGRLENGTYHFFGVGGNFNIYLAKTTKKSKYLNPDIRFNMEFGLLPVLYEVQSNKTKFLPIFNFGLSFGGKGLFECYGYGRGKYCPGDIFLRILSIVFALGTQ